MLFDMRSWLRNIFKLLPPEKRSGGKLGEWLFGNQRELRNNDSYITYSVIRNTLAISAVVGIVSLLFALYIESNIPEGIYSYSGEDSVKMSYGVVGFYMRNHSFVVGWITLILSIYYFMLFIVNVPKGSLDVFRHERFLKYKKNREIKVYVDFQYSSLLIGIAIWLLCTFFAGHSIEGIMSLFGVIPNESNKYFLLITFYFFLVFAHASGAWALHKCLYFAYSARSGYLEYGGK